MSNFTAELKWFQENTNNLVSFLSKVSPDDIKYRDNLRTKIQTAMKFILSHDDPYYKEIAFIIYWSCINEFIFQYFNNGNNYVNFKNKSHSENIIENSETYYFAVKAKPKTKLTNPYTYIYRKKKERRNTSQKNYKLPPSFLIGAYLNFKQGSNYQIQYDYSCLANKRNKLSLIHDDSRAIVEREFYDSVDIENCRNMFDMTSFLFDFKLTQFSKYKDHNVSIKNIKGIKLGIIKHIDSVTVTLKDESYEETVFQLSKRFSASSSFLIGDFVELIFEMDEKKISNIVRDIIFLF